MSFSDWIGIVVPRQFESTLLAAKLSRTGAAANLNLN